MILVILGTQNMPFTRLLNAIQKEVDKGNLNDEIIVQAGVTKFESPNMKVFDLIPGHEFDELVKTADLVITHAGVGSILGAITNGKTVIAAARDEKYGEHVNDHQLQIIENFANNGYILELSNFDELDKILKKTKNFIPKKYKSNTKKFIKLVEKEIGQLCKKF